MLGMAFLMSAFLSARGSAQDEFPWKTHPPIVEIRKELYREHPRPGVAALVSMSYVGSGLERREIHAVEYRDDVPDEPMVRFSTDDGRSWSEFEPLPPTLSYPKGTEVWEGGGAHRFDPRSGVLVGTWLRQINLSGLYNCFTYWRLSRDFGRTWSPPKRFKYEAGEDFDPENPLKPEFLLRDQGYFGSNILAHRNGTLIHCLAHANAPGDPENDKRAWRMGSLCLIGRWNPQAEDYDWTPGKRVEISPAVSSRGLMEPELAELSDGRVLVIWRGSNTETTPGRKWYSLSEDGGLTLSEPRELLYDDGTRFFSPSSYHRMIRHGRTGNLYWIGNISEVPPQGNWPRYPLVIAEVEESLPALRKSTVTAIDDRRPEQTDQVQFSNFSLLEDRETGDLELYLTTYGQVPESVWTADCFKYTLRLR